MLDFAIFAVSFVIFLLIIVFYLYPGSAKATSIPGMDPSDPKEGNVPDILQAGSLHNFLENLHEEHGPIASFWMGSTLTASIAAPELFEQQLHVFDKPVDLFTLYKPITGDGSLLFSNGTEGRKRRQQFDKIICYMNNEFTFTQLKEFADELIKKWTTLPTEQHIPVFQYVMALCMKACMYLGFGDYFLDGKEVLEFSRNFEICWMELEARVTGSIPDPESLRNERFLEAVERLHKTIRKSLHSRQSKEKKNPILLDHLMELNVPEEQILNDGVVFVVKHYSLVFAMVWAIYFLATHKDVQEKVYKELKDVVGSSSLSYTVLPKLKYLRQVINETLRMAAVEPWTARCQDLDAEIGGHIIPKKTPVIQALGVVLHSENYWSLPKMFNPDRFDEDGTNSRSKLAFQPFGFSGKRKCPGCDLVYVQLALYISVICTKFELHLVDGQVVNPLQRVITRPEDEVWITISPRS